MTRITKAGLDHLYALRLLWQMLARESTMVYPKLEDSSLNDFTLSIAEVMQNPNNRFAAFIAWKGRKPIGFIGGEIRSRPIGYPRHYAVCHWIYVRANHRHMGVAADLIAKGIEWIREQQVPVVGSNGHHTEHVEVVELASAYGDNSWERRGFTPFSTNYMLPVTDISLNNRAVLKKRPGLEVDTNAIHGDAR